MSRSQRLARLEGSRPAAREDLPNGTLAKMLGLIGQSELLEAVQGLGAELDAGRMTEEALVERLRLLFSSRAHVAAVALRLLRGER